MHIPGTSPVPPGTAPILNYRPDEVSTSLANLTAAVLWLWTAAAILMGGGGALLWIGLAFYSAQGPRFNGDLICSWPLVLPLLLLLNSGLKTAALARDAYRPELAALAARAHGIHVITRLWMIPSAVGVLLAVLAWTIRDPVICVVALFPLLPWAFLIWLDRSLKSALIRASERQGETTDRGILP